MLRSLSEQTRQHLEEHAKFPEMDLKQRLAVRRGYAVAEMQVTKRSPFRNKTLAESGFRDQDIVVLSVTREDEEILNPRGDLEIATGVEIELQDGSSIRVTGDLRNDRHTECPTGCTPSR